MHVLGGYELCLATRSLVTMIDIMCQEWENKHAFVHTFSNK